MTNVLTHPSNTWVVIFVVLGTLSILSGSIIPFIYYKVPKMRQYPAIILVLICIVETIEIYHTLVTVVLYNYNFLTKMLDSLAYSITLGAFYKDPSDKRFLCECNLLILLLVILIQQALQMCWCSDFCLTLYKPFTSTKRRLQIYMIFTLVFSSIQFWVNDYQIRDFCTKDGSSFFLTYINWKALTIQYIYYFVCGTSLIMTIKVRWQTGKQKNQLNKQIKIQYLNQQILITSIVLIIWGIPTCILYFLTDVLLQNIAVAMLLSQGILLAGVRMSEPFFRSRLLIGIKIIFGKASLQEKNILGGGETKDWAPEQWNVPIASLLRMVQSQDVLQGILEGLLSSIKHKSSRQIDDQKKTSVEKLSKIKTENKTMIYSQYVNTPKINNKVQVDESDIDGYRRVNEECIDVKVQQYAPEIFQNLRKLENISNLDLEESLKIENNEESIKKLSESLGKSGSFFFFSQDNKFILKTMKKKELDLILRHFLMEYYYYIHDNPKSLLARIYGCFTIEIPNVSAVHLILIENTFELFQGSPEQVYDLKGSIVNRVSKNNKIGLDVDWLNNTSVFLHIDQQKRDQVMEQIKSDSDFLTRLNLMDYSLLVGIKGGKGDDLKGQENHRYFFEESENGRRVFCLGIIDFLQEFNLQKYLEGRYKSIFNKSSLISSIKPKEYGRRFLSFFNSIICSYTIHK